ncbi:hypothetical protein [Derxia gummosa]|uniref:7-cyano-7-deazaguanine synthase n=1 Tax=Derxia gummosa DSM 723 TaxID=1121388 RepID=A0A8B6XA94_9BURK|nr:hypothetical protein [Derxia gummosa]
MDPKPSSGNCPNTLLVGAPRVTGSERYVRHSADISLLTPAGRQDFGELWFEAERPWAWEAPDAEIFLLAVYQWAMALNADVRIDGTVTHGLLANLEEFGEAWVRWIPKTYKRIRVFAQAVQEPSLPAAPFDAVAAFSGGVDATFTAMRHAKAQVGYRSRKLQACAFIHGFDIGLDDEAAYEHAFEGARRTLDDVKVPLVRIRTNFRQLVPVSWEDAHVAALAAAMHTVQGVARAALVGSTKAYDELVIPYGSLPITDALLTSERMQIIHDGASHTRTQKVAAIATWPAGAQGLRVCWQEASMGRNCGKCEKCVRSMLNFRVSNLPIPDCFDEPLKPARILKAKMRAAPIFKEYYSLFMHGLKHGASPTILVPIAIVLGFAPIRWLWSNGLALPGRVIRKLGRMRAAKRAGGAPSVPAAMIPKCAKPAVFENTRSRTV